MPTIAVFTDLDRLSQAALADVSAAIADTEPSRRFSVVLAGGSTPLRLYTLLASPVVAATIPWHRLELYWGDERWVPHDHPDSNYGATRRALLDHVPVPASQVHPVPTDLPTPEASAKAYDTTLRKTLRASSGDLPHFDLVLLGMGPDGHTASLFPGSPLLAERERLACAVLDAPKPPPQRVTLTLPVLNAAARVLFLAAGADKAAALRDAILGDGPSVPPSGLVRPAGELTWLVDAAAAQHLPAAIPGWTVKRQG